MPVIDTPSRQQGNEVATDFISSITSLGDSFYLPGNVTSDYLRIDNLTTGDLYVTVGAQTDVLIQAFESASFTTETFAEFYIRASIGMGSFRARVSHFEYDEPDEKKLDNKIGTLQESVNDTTSQLRNLVIIPKRLPTEVVHSPAIRRALDDILANGKGTIFFADKETLINEDIIVYSNVAYIGRGKKLSTIKVADGSNCNVFKSNNFEQLSKIYNGGTYPSNYDSLIPVGFVIKDLYVDGNMANNTSGYGFKIYGKNYEIDNVRANYIAEVGAYFECKESETGKINMQITVTGKEGLIYRGASDQTIQRVNVGKAGQKALNADGTVNQSLNVSDIYPGENIHGVVIDSACEIGEMHVWETWTGYGIKYTSAARNKTDHLVVDNCTGGLWIDGAHTQMGLVDLHNIYGRCIWLKGDSAKTLSNVIIFRYSTNVAFGDQLYIEGTNNDVTIKDRDGSLVPAGSSAIVLKGAFNNRIKGTFRGYVNSDVVKFLGGYRNDLELITENCLNVLGVEANLYHSDITIKSMMNAGQTLYVLRNSATIDFQRSGFKVLATVENAGAITQNLTSKFKNIFANVVDLTSTAEQSFTLDHTYFKVPHPMDITLRLDAAASLMDYQVAYIKTTTQTATTITVKVKLSVASATALAKGNLFVKID